MAKKKKIRRKGKRKRPQRPSSQKWKLYKIEGDKIIRLRPFCPKCGPGVFMADHGDRFTCGKCGYTEWKKK